MTTMTRSRIGDRIFLVRFETQYALASSFLRFQEHYESSRFRNRVFSLEQFMDWYAARSGAFTYYEDWSGFNVPSTAFAPFYQGRFDPLLEKEKRLLRLFERESTPFYVIGIAADQSLTHELAHALFFTRPAYRQAVRDAMRAVRHGRDQEAADGARLSPQRPDRRSARLPDCRNRSAGRVGSRAGRVEATASRDLS